MMFLMNSSFQDDVVFYMYAIILPYHLTVDAISTKPCLNVNQSGRLHKEFLKSFKEFMRHTASRIFRYLTLLGYNIF